MNQARYTVVWAKPVYEAFTELWLESGSDRRRLLTEASHAIDRGLATQPSTHGRPTPFEPGVLTWVLPGQLASVTVYFEVIEDDRVVRVVRVSVRV